MSYILDALKRADAERERGGVPGVHTRQVSALVVNSNGANPGRNRNRVLLTLVLGVAVAALWAWYRSSGFLSAPPSQSAASTPLVRSSPALLAPVSLPSAVPDRPPVLSTPAASPILAPMKPVSKPVVAPPAHAVAAGQGTAVVALLAELPPEVGRAIPSLTINGVVFSDNPGQRLLLINGQVLPQGSMVAPEVSLEEIGQHGSVFNYHGTRFRLTH